MVLITIAIYGKNLNPLKVKSDSLEVIRYEFSYG